LTENTEIENHNKKIKEKLETAKKYE